MYECFLQEIIIAYKIWILNEAIIRKPLLSGYVLAKIVSVLENNKTKENIILSNLSFIIITFFLQILAYA